MKQAISLRVAAGCLLAVAAGVAAPVEIFVSPDGNDANVGTRSRPVATPAGARDSLRKARESNGGALPKGGAVVEFADGTYALSAPLALDRRDSGAPEAPVVWRAANAIENAGGV